MRDQVFISYSHKDEGWLRKLRTHLRPFERTHKIEVWGDTHIESGDRWRREIEGALGAAKVAILLVSPDYLASDFIAYSELPPLLKAAEREGLRILWVAVSAGAYLETPIKDYHAASDPARPLDSLKPSRLNEELVRICEAVHAAADDEEHACVNESADSAADRTSIGQPTQRTAKPARDTAAPQPDTTYLFLDGAVGRNTARGDSFVNLDFAVAKRFAMKEGQYLRSERRSLTPLTAPTSASPSVTSARPASARPSKRTAPRA